MAELESPDESACSSDERSVAIGSFELRVVELVSGVTELATLLADELPLVPNKEDNNELSRAVDEIDKDKGNLLVE